WPYAVLHDAGAPVQSLTPDRLPVASTLPTIYTALEAGKLTYAGVGIFEQTLFGKLSGTEPAALASLLRAAMRRSQVIGAHYPGVWVDVGTPARLQMLDARLREQQSPRLTSRT